MSTFVAAVALLAFAALIADLAFAERRARRRDRRHTPSARWEGRIAGTQPDHPPTRRNP